MGKTLSVYVRRVGAIVVMAVVVAVPVGLALVAVGVIGLAQEPEGTVALARVVPQRPRLFLGPAPARRRPLAFRAGAQHAADRIAHGIGNRLAERAGDLVAQLLPQRVEVAGKPSQPVGQRRADGRHQSGHGKVEGQKCFVDQLS